jgi:hypothetical protein
VSIQGPSSALIWSTDLKLGFLPAVCVKTGRPADASVKFRFITVPGWAYYFLLLALTGIGLLLPFIIMRLVSRVETGRLPYLSAVARRLRILRWALLVGFIAIPVLLVVALAAIGGDTTIAVLLWVLLLADLLGVIVVRYVVLPMQGPNGYVHDSPYPQGRWVELRRVHPDFAAALGEMYNARLTAAQLQPATPSADALAAPPA